MTSETPNSGRKLFFGLFIFPLLIAVGMAVLLCGVVLLTHEDQTPESLLASIKTGPPAKRWEKAYELSNELNKKKPGLRQEALVKEMSAIALDSRRYDLKTRAYMAMVLGRFSTPESVATLQTLLKEGNDELSLYALWSLGEAKAQTAAEDIRTFLKHENPALRKTAAYVLGVLGDRSQAAPLKNLLRDPVEDVRWNAALALARLGDGSGHEVLLEMLDRGKLTSMNMNEEALQSTMVNAIRGLALIRSRESITILETLSKTDKNLKVRQAAIDALKIINVVRET